jgi:uncharacterized membrane protein YgcG
MSEDEIGAFADRVMTAIETVPAPTPVRAFGWSLRARSWRDALASLAVAWHLGTVRRWSVAPRIRARSMALLLAVTSVLATGSLVAAATAVRVAARNDDRRPPVTTPVTIPTSAPIMDGPGLDDSYQDLVRVPPAQPVQPGAVKSEPTGRPSDAHGSESRDPGTQPAGTTRSSEDRDATESLDGSGGDGTHESDSNGRDGSGDSGHDSGGGQSAGSDSSDGGRD